MDKEAREGRLRRMAERRKLILRAASDRGPDRYMLIDAETREPVLGGLPVRYSATLDDVAEYIVG
jgi:hypothetical protein